MSDNDSSLPKTYEAFVARFPKVAEAHQNTARALADAGPLDDRAISLVKLAICVGAGLESAVKSHVRRALDAGVSVEEIEHVLMLGMNSIGFPSSVAAWQWGHQALNESDD
jgi:alkylhydroperoxidase/carboxymuconolactone decarboxylase family protein YurZ